MLSGNDTGSFHTATACSSNSRGEFSMALAVQGRPAASTFTQSILFPAYCVAAILFVVHLLTASKYGYFRDELYFIACSDHLAAGYVDFAPLAAWILKLNRVLLGDSLLALRWLPGLAHAAEVLLTGMLAPPTGGQGSAVFFFSLWGGLPPLVV